MTHALLKNTALAVTLSLLIAPAALAASGSSTAASSTSAKSGITSGPVVGNINGSDKETTARDPAPDNSGSTDTPSKPVKSRVSTDSSNPYGSSPVARTTDSGSIDSDGNAVGTPVTEETRDADTNNDGRASKSELDNAANGGDIHSTKR